MGFKDLAKFFLPFATATGSIVGLVKAAVASTDSFANDPLQQASSVVAPPSTGIYNSTDFSSSFETNTFSQPQASLLSYENAYSSNNLNLGEEERQKRIAQADKIHKVLNDYTFKLVYPCNSATGWILDYELPKENGKYPTTWYFGTASHVVKKWRFAENPYEQILPISAEATKSIRALGRNRQFDWSEVGLLSKKGCWSDRVQGYFDIAIIRQDSDFNYKSDLGLLHKKKIKEPKLFYTPINFLDKDNSLDVGDEHQRDLAIIEVEFTDEKIARQVTNDFATKYPVESTKALNFFAPSLTKKYTEEELNKSEEDFYHLGYPIAGGQWKYTTTFNPNTGRGLRLSDDIERYLVNGRERKRIRGLANANRIFNFLWDNKTRSSVGSNYVMKSDSEEYRLTGGASGGLITDKDGNVLGLLEASKELGDLRSFWVPLRQSKIEGSEEGDLRSPEYDFILGVTGQKNSYRAQVEKYKKNTWLKARGWAHKTK